MRQSLEGDTERPLSRATRPRACQRWAGSWTGLRTRDARTSSMACAHPRAVHAGRLPTVQSQQACQCAGPAAGCELVTVHVFYLSRAGKVSGASWLQRASVCLLRACVGACQAPAACTYHLQEPAGQVQLSSCCGSAHPSVTRKCWAQVLGCREGSHGRGCPGVCSCSRAAHRRPVLAAHPLRCAPVCCPLTPGLPERRCCWMAAPQTSRTASVCLPVRACWLHRACRGYMQRHLSMQRGRAVCLADVSLLQAATSPSGESGSCPRAHGSTWPQRCRTASTRRSTPA